MPLVGNGAARPKRGHWKGSEGVLMLAIDGIIYSLQKFGGITVYFNELLSGLCAENIGFTFLCEASTLGTVPECASTYREDTPRRIVERFRNVRVPEGVQLFHSSYYRLAKGRKVINVTTVHDFTYEKLLRGPKRWAHSWQKFNAIRGSDLVICVSDSTREDLISYLPEVPPQRVRVVYNGVGSEFRPLSRSTDHAGRYAIFVGSRAAYKNFDKAIQAVGLVPGLELYVVGGGALQKDERIALERYLPGRYHHTGTVTAEKLNEIYNGAVCLLYPSSYEGFGIPVLEAMRAGCPVVATNTPAIAEISGDAAKLVAEPQPELLAQAVEDVFQTEEGRLLRSRGFAHSEQFSWARTVRETVQLYEELIGHELIHR